jgi:DNA-binding response OmpR family regulator
MSPRQLVARLSFWQRRRRRHALEQLKINALASRGDKKALTDAERKLKAE